MKPPGVSSGDQLGPYRVVAPIGEGGMGEVWKACDTRLDRTVAIKLSKQEFTERFEREARAIGALNHPNICQLYDVGPNYLVMEYIEGVALKGPLPVEKAVEYAGQILEALDAAHRKGITHRDLKPANILVTKQGIKLLDFGLAKNSVPLESTDATLTEALTRKGQIVGTLQYMSPEQIQGREASPRSDIFSFGCVLYELLSGKRAFEGGSAASVIAAVLEREPAIDVSPELERIIRRCLDKDPDHRFQTAADLKTALLWAVTTSAGAAPSPRRRAWLPAALALAGVAFGAAAVSLWRSPSRHHGEVLHFDIDPPAGSDFLLGSQSIGFALSPDGKFLAYVAAANGKSTLWVRSLEDGTTEKLPGTENGRRPFWSPDGRFLAFVNDAKLQKVEVNGGLPQTVAEEVGAGGWWSRSGAILAGSPRGLLQIPASGGPALLLTAIDKSRLEERHVWPQVLPDGQVLYLAISQKKEQSGVYLTSFANPGQRTFLLQTDTRAEYNNGYLLWLRGNTLVAQKLDTARRTLVGEEHSVATPVGRYASLGTLFASASNTLLVYSTVSRESQLAWFDADGKRNTLTEEAGEYTSFRISPDSKRVAIRRPTGGVDADIWILEVERRVMNRLTTDPGNNTYPVWSPDGKRILYGLKPAGGEFTVLVRDIAGEQQEVGLMRSADYLFPTDWSRDGRHALIQELARSSSKLWILSMAGATGERAKSLFPQPVAGVGTARFSPEGSPRWVAFESRETGQNEVYVAPFPKGSPKWRISTNGGRYPNWGATSRELYYLSPDDKLMKVRLEQNGNAVEASQPELLFPLNAVDTGSSPFNVSPDGQRILVRAVPENAPKTLKAVVNWPSLLNKPGRE